MGKVYEDLLNKRRPCTIHLSYLKIRPLAEVYALNVRKGDSI